MRLTLSVILLFFVSGLLAQEAFEITGVVINKKTKAPVPFVALGIPEINLWTTTETDGTFTIQNIHLQNFTIVTSALGYTDYKEKHNLSELQEKPFTLYLTPISYDMEEVTVLAKNGAQATSSTKIGEVAIEYVQPASLADVMQLLPGNIVDENPDLSKTQQISIREIGTDNNSAMGTAILLDGAPISNDANLQTYATSNSIDNFNTNSGAGVDLREISTGNIESMEVLKGIPSVAYGDLTSGAVVIKSKAGYTPLEIKLKTDPKIKQIAVNKGIKMKNQIGAINLYFDYLNSYKDLRSKYIGYNRLSASAQYSRVFKINNKPLSMNTKLAFSGTIDQQKTDPDALVKNEFIKSENNTIRWSLRGKYVQKNMFFTNLNYNVNINYAHQVRYEEMYRSSSDIEIITTSTTEGQSEARYLPSEQLTQYTIDGKPLTLFAQLLAHKTNIIGKETVNKLMYGVEFRYNANLGEGKIYDINNPPFVSTYTSRPRKYSDIPPAKSVSYFIEDKLFLPIRKTYLDIQFGVRLNNYQTQSIFKSELGFNIEPRFNAEYRLLSKENNQTFDKLSVSIGIGKTYKSPPLLYLYPDLAYFDFPVLNYYTGDPETNLALIQTYIFETTNPEIRCAENQKKEIGLEMRINKINASVTLFKEKLSHGFDFTKIYNFIELEQYNADEVTPGTQPVPDNLTTAKYTTPASYRLPTNNKASEKIGVEYTLSLGKIKALYTTVAIDGAWLKTTRTYNTSSYQYQPSSTNAQPYLYYGVYPAGEQKVSERFNTTLRLVTQIPKLRLIFSTASQIIWFDKYHYPEYDEAPIELVHADGSTQAFTDEMRTSPDYIRFVDEKSDSYYTEESKPTLLLVNFKLSKEIGDAAKLSFYANNFLNYRPTYQYDRSGTYTRLNPELYFGAELKIKL